MWVEIESLINIKLGVINQKNRASKRKTKKKQFSSVSLKSGQEGKKARKQAALCSSIHLIRVTNGIWQ